MRHSPLVSLIFMLAASLLVACGDNDTRSGPGVEKASHAIPGLLRRGNGSEPATLDPHRAEGVPAANILRDLFEGLVTEDAAGKLIPGAAESWTTSDDGLTWTFTLRDNGRWSNGDPVTAADFVYSLRRSVDPATGSQYSIILAPIAGAEAIIAGRAKPDTLGVTAPDARTVVIRLKAPTPYIAGLLTHASAYPVHAASLAEHGDRFTRPGNLVGNGAFVLTDWRLQDHIRIERNPHYHDAANVALEAVQYYPIDDQEAELKRYRAGELDWTETIPLNRCEWARENLPGQVQLHPYLGVYYYALNVSRPPLNNPKLRRALSLAVDRELLTGAITKCGEQPAFNWVPPQVPEHSAQRMDFADWSQEERNAEAKKLFAEAGYGPDQPLTLQLRYNTSDAHKKIAIAVQAMWKEVLGLGLSLHNEEWKVFLANRRNKDITQVFRAGWIGDYNDPFTFLEILQSNSGMNDLGYRSRKYDQLLQQASSTADTDERRYLLELAEGVLLSDQPVIPIYHYVSKSLVKPWVKGWQGNLMDHHHSRFLRIDTTAP